MVDSENQHKVGICDGQRELAPIHHIVVLAQKHIAVDIQNQHKVSISQWIFRTRTKSAYVMDGENQHKVTILWSYHKISISRQTFKTRIKLAYVMDGENQHKVSICNRQQEVAQSHYIVVLAQNKHIAVDIQNQHKVSIYGGLRELENSVDCENSVETARAKKKLASEDQQKVSILTDQYKVSILPRTSITSAHVIDSKSHGLVRNFLHHAYSA